MHDKMGYPGYAVKRGRVGPPPREDPKSHEMVMTLRDFVWLFWIKERKDRD